MFDDDKAAGGSDSKADDNADDKAKDQKVDDDSTVDGVKVEGLNDNGKDALRRLKEQREAARKEAADTKAERDALLKEKTDRDAAEQARKDKEAAESGKWEELATKREGELKSAKDEGAALKAENDQLREAMKTGTESGWKDLPDPVRKLGEKQHPEDDVLGRWTFLHDPDTTALVKELTSRGDTARGNGADPKSRGSGKVTDEAKKQAQAGLYSRF